MSNLDGLNKMQKVLLIRTFSLNQLIACLLFVTYCHAVEVKTSWQPIGDEIDQTIYQIDIDKNDNVFASGFSPESSSAWYWNNKVWSKPPFSNQSFGEVLGISKTVKAPNGDLYCLGRIETLKGDTVLQFLKWDGATWSTVDYMSEKITSFAFGNNQDIVAVVSKKDTVNGVILNPGVAKWNGTVWSPLGSDEFADLVAVHPNGTPYITTKSNLIRRWSGTAWTNVTGMPTRTYGLAIYHGMLFDSKGGLYVYGTFEKVRVDGVYVTCNNIARYDESKSNWSSLGYGVDREIVTVARDRFDRIWVGGAMGSMTYDKATVSYWDGAKWTNLPSFTSTTKSEVVWSLAIDSEDWMYVGGSFESLDGVISPHISRIKLEAATTKNSNLISKPTSILKSNLKFDLLGRYQTLVDPMNTEQKSRAH